MADFQNVLIDGKLLTSLRVVDLKQELKKRGIKANGTKAQLQSLLFQQLNEYNNEAEKTTERDETLKQSDDEISQQITEPSDSSLGYDATNTPSVDEEDNERHSNDLSENLDRPTDLTKESAITSSVSFNEEKESIKLTIKLQPNDYSTKIIKASDSSPRKETSPKKEMRTPLLSSNKKMETLKTQNKEEIREKTPEPKDLSLHKESADIVTDLSVNEEKQICKNSDHEIIGSVVQSSEEVITESVNEEKRTKSQSEEETREQKAEPIVSSLEKEVITTILPIIEDKGIQNSQSSVELIRETTEIKSDLILDKNSQIPNISFDEIKSDLTSDKIIKIQNNSLIEVKSDLTSDKITEIQNNSLESEPKVEKGRPPRKRRWGGTSTGNDFQQNAYKGISSDQLKELIPDLNCATSQTTASNNDNALSIPKVEPKLIVAKSEPKQTVAKTEPKQIVAKSEPKQTVAKTEPKQIIAKTDSIQEQELKREVSPARNVESNIIFIRNLVRPFTLLQLKDVLGRTGKLIEERFWIDKIKSKCYATYDTVGEAIATRQALHGIRWPASNPKLLCVDFANKEELDSLLNEEININKEVVNTNNRKIDENVVNEKYDIIIKKDDKSVFREKNENNDTLKNKTETRPIREWDREKLTNKEETEKSRTPVKRRLRSPSPRNRSQERSELKRRRHDSTKGGEQKTGPAPTAETVQETESPAKLLDDLFKKTTATPSIYWLPLTEEQVIARIALREETDKKRQEERIAREAGRRMSPSRRPSPRRLGPVRRSPPRRPIPARNYSRSRQ